MQCESCELSGEQFWEECDRTGGGGGGAVVLPYREQCDRTGGGDGGAISGTVR